MMQAATHSKPNGYSNRSVSVNQAIKILKRNGIEVTGDQAQIILDFLYVIAKTYCPVENTMDLRPQWDIEHLKPSN